jgi:hypothetical protein
MQCNTSLALEIDLSLRNQDVAFLAEELSRLARSGLRTWTCERAKRESPLAWTKKKVENTD